MPKESSPASGQYADVIARLETIVESLERGELSLEDSLERFAEGMRLVKQGEALLGDAEKRIEQLMTEDGKTVPLSVPDGGEAVAAPAQLTPAPSRAVRRAPAPATAPARSEPPRSEPVDDGEDVPF